ncbi:hypothetical protein D3C72_1761090 [compost metagenome]
MFSLYKLFKVVRIGSNWAAACTPGMPFFARADISMPADKVVLTVRTSRSKAPACEENCALYSHCTVAWRPPSSSRSKSSGISR